MTFSLRHGFWVSTSCLALGCVFDGEVIEPAGAGGSTTATTTTSATGGGGGGDPCMVPEDCEDPGECATRTCDGGLCGVDPLPVGTAVTGQTEDDCRVQECDGQGAVVSSADLTDVPPDEDCTTFECDATGVVATNLPATTPCGVGSDLECDGSGVCVGCMNATQCPAGANVCQTAACSPAMVCSIVFATAGMLVPGNPANDCKRTECDAVGGVVTVNDGSDLPLTDSNPCTNEVCTAGVPSQPNRPAGTVVAPENGVACDGVCQAGLYAGTCGLRLYSRTFPMSGTWSSVALSSAWTGANAPPPTLITAVEETTSGSRLMVFRSTGTYYEFFGGVWQAPVAATTRFSGLQSGTNIAGALTGRFSDPDDLMIIGTTDPVSYSYTIPDVGGAPVYSSGPDPVTNDQATYGSNAPPQHTTPFTWIFGEQRAVYGATPDSHVSWKAMLGNVYYEWAGSAGFSYPAAPTTEAASALAINGSNGSPAPGTTVAAYYHDATSTVFLVAP